MVPAGARARVLVLSALAALPAGVPATHGLPSVADWLGRALAVWRAQWVIWIDRTLQLSPVRHRPSPTPWPPPWPAPSRGPR